jgi:hypothetical protein
MEKIFNALENLLWLLGIVTLGFIAFGVISPTVQNLAAALCCVLSSYYFFKLKIGRD